MKIFTRRDMERAYICGKNDGTKYDFQNLTRDILRTEAKYRALREQKNKKKVVL